jgi:hypothetical protein
MDVRTLATRSVVASARVGLVLVVLLFFAGHQRAAAGALFGALIGCINQVMLAVRVAGIGRYGTARQTQAVMLANTGMRFLLIGLATYLCIRLPEAMSLLGFATGLLAMMVTSTVVTARALLREKD